jgi:hypothetical protein
MAREASLVKIMIDGVDRTHHVVFAQTSFDASANATPGTGKIMLKDVEHAFTDANFIHGRDIVVLIGDDADHMEPLWGGPIMSLGRRHFFPVVDSTDYEHIPQRQWVIGGPDWNVIFDRRVQRNTKDYTSWIANERGAVGDIIKKTLPRYYDLADIDTHSFVDNTDLVYPKGIMCGQGTYLRQQMEDFAQYGGAVYYIDPQKRLHFHPDENSYPGGVTADKAWHFTDWKPDRVRSVPFREANISEEGLEMITDALVWGGSDLPGTASDQPNTPAGSIVFARYPTSPPHDELIHGDPAWVAEVAGPVASNATQIPYNRVSGTPAAGAISIGLEHLNVTKVANDELTVDRAQDGTPALSFVRHDRIVHTAVPDVMLKKEREQEALDNIVRYGRWQRSEQHAGESGYLQQESVDQRAYTMISGAPGTDPTGGATGGLDRPVWSISVSWFDHDVPNGRRLHVGDMVQFYFYTMGQKDWLNPATGKKERRPLIITLPCRTLHISFPGLDEDGRGYVRYDGEFGIAQSDPRFLWKFLLHQQRTAMRQPGLPAIVDTRGSGGAGAGAASTVGGSVGHYVPHENPDGSRVQFTLPSPYWTGTTEVYINGLLQRPGLDYSEEDPTTGTVTFYSAPYADDKLYVICRTGEQ